MYKKYAKEKYSSFNINNTLINLLLMLQYQGQIFPQLVTL